MNSNGRTRETSSQISPHVIRVESEVPNVFTIQFLGVYLASKGCSMASFRVCAHCDVLARPSFRMYSSNLGCGAFQNFVISKPHIEFGDPLGNFLHVTDKLAAFRLVHEDHAWRRRIPILHICSQPATTTRLPASGCVPTFL